MENNEISFIINDAGNAFYAKWKKDTIVGLFLLGPICFFFVFMCFTMIVGISIKLLLILIFPTVLILILFIYGPLFVRKKYFNYMIKFIMIKDNICTIETYKWFFWSPVSASFSMVNLEIKESFDQSIFRDRKRHQISFKDFTDKPFYIIDDFFDNINDLLKVIKG